MQIPFVDLTQTTNQVKSDYLKAVEKILTDSHFILTEEVAEFEKAWAKTVGARFCVGTSNGADALYLALQALDIGLGDEVITQGNAYNASVAAILRTGAVPRFADINPDSLTIDVSKIEKLINDKTKAILPVHLYGQPNDMEAIVKIAKKYKLGVVEDCAQAHLAEINGRKVGTFGDVGAFSFYPTKNLGAFGDAGAIVTDSEELKDKIEALRSLGEVAKNQHKFLGFNMRLDPIQAVCLSLKLKYLDENTKARQKAAEYYDKIIAEANVSIEPLKKLGNHVYHLYVIKVKHFYRDKLKDELAQEGMQTAIHYPVPVYNQPFYQGPKDPCPVADETSKQILSLPFFVGITGEQQKFVVEKIKNIMSA